MISAILSRIADQYRLRRLSGRYTGPCPKCGGSANSDKFVIKDDGGFKCYACTDMHGDIITWLMDMEQMKCPEAYEAAGRECLRTSCAVRSNCRMGEGKGRRQPQAATTRRPLAPQEVARVSELPTISAKGPDALWSSWATELVAGAAGAIDPQAAVLTWLDGRGIDPASVTRFQLGWLAHDRKVERATIGLAPRADGKTTLWIPGGLLIPIIDDNGAIHRIRVRRTKEARGRFLPDLKYVWIEGSGNCPLVIRPQGPSRGTVIVEAELDAYACAAAHDRVTVIAIGSVAAGLTEELRAELTASPVILVALDADPAKDGRRGPGPAAVANWSRLYRQARFYPLPSSKDPGDYAQAGGDLQAWIESGLVPEPPSVSAAHDSSLCPERPQRGAGGNGELSETEEPGAGVAIMTLVDGREVHITDHEPTWHHLAMAGKIVFSKNELERLKAACSTMDASEAGRAALMAVDLKEVFLAAYIREGRQG